jgi:hypothetical protein
MLGDDASACSHYELASIHLRELPAGPYADMVQQGIADGLRRVLPTAR